jgi:hypothetical protein
VSEREGTGSSARAAPRAARSPAPGGTAWPAVGRVARSRRTGHPGRWKRLAFKPPPWHSPGSDWLSNCRRWNCLARWECVAAPLEATGFQFISNRHLWNCVARWERVAAPGKRLAFKPPPLGLRGLSGACRGPRRQPRLRAATSRPSRKPGTSNPAHLPNSRGRGAHPAACPRRPAASWPPRAAADPPADPRCTCKDKRSAGPGVRQRPTGASIEVPQQATPAALFCALRRRRVESA